MSNLLRTLALLTSCASPAAAFGVPIALQPAQAVAEPGRELYARACANCHGPDGRGGERAILAFEDPLPDFTDCNFATREPNADWMAILHDGGPSRAFGRMMPAFGDALSIEELSRTLEYVRSFCPDPAWPAGDLNLPRALVTEKAFPEDEVVITSAAALTGSGEISNKFVYERRFGARNQLELVVPFSARVEGSGDGPWIGGIGDVVAGVKRAFYHDLARGSIFSAAAEVIFPTGSEERDFGKGTPVFEPFVAFGQILPRDSFFQLQSGIELPADTDKAAREMFVRVALGRSFSQQRWGRTWSPMAEIVAARELVDGEPLVWDIVPQLQVTLSTRQHIMVNVGVRIPLNERDRSTQLVMYFLWDWFDGPLFKGW